MQGCAYLDWAVACWQAQPGKCRAHAPAKCRLQPCDASDWHWPGPVHVIISFGRLDGAASLLRSQHDSSNQSMRARSKPCMQSVELRSPDQSSACGSWPSTFGKSRLAHSGVDHLLHSIQRASAWAVDACMRTIMPASDDLNSWQATWTWLAARV